MVSQRALLSLLSLASGSLAWKHAEEKALREALKANDHSMVAFVKPGTEFSDALEADWTALEAKHANFYSVDCAENGDVCDSFGISNYPAVRFIRSAGDHFIYRGPRNAQQISSFLRRAVRTAVTGVDTQNATSFITIDDIVFILHMTDEDAGKGLYARYHALAEHYKDRYSFAVAKIEQGPSLLHCYNNLEDRSDTMANFFERIPDLDNFVRACAEPLVTELTRVNNAEIVDGPWGPPSRLYFFEHDENNRKNLITRMRDLAKRYDDKIKFVVVAPGDHVDLLKKVKLDWSQTPGVVLHNREGNQFYHFANQWDVSEQATSDFIKSVFEGKIAAWKKPVDAHRIMQEAETAAAAEAETQAEATIAGEGDAGAQTPVVEIPVVETPEAQAEAEKAAHDEL